MHWGSTIPIRKSKICNGPTEQNLSQDEEEQVPASLLSLFFHMSEICFIAAFLVVTDRDDLNSLHLAVEQHIKERAKLP